MSGSEGATRGGQAVNVPKDGASSDLLKKASLFEKSIDPTDDAQLKLLKEMKELTAQIEYNRGDWNQITSFRNWNEYRPPVFEPPMAIESLRDFKAQETKDVRALLEPSTRNPSMLPLTPYPSGGRNS